MKAARISCGFFLTCSIRVKERIKTLGLWKNFGGLRPFRAWDLFWIIVHSALHCVCDYAPSELVFIQHTVFRCIELPNEKDFRLVDIFCSSMPSSEMKCIKMVSPKGAVSIAQCTALCSRITHDQEALKERNPE